jgi:hypothetical protein
MIFWNRIHPLTIHAKCQGQGSPSQNPGSASKLYNSCIKIKLTYYYNVLVQNVVATSLNFPPKHILQHDFKIMPTYLI